MRTGPLFGIAIVLALSVGAASGLWASAETEIAESSQQRDTIDSARLQTVSVMGEGYNPAPPWIPVS